MLSSVIALKNKRRTMSAPRFEKAPSILNKPDGSVLFECMCNSVTPPEVKWLHKGTEVPPDERHVMKVKKMVGKYACTMIMKSPSQADQGIWTVVATNGKGEARVEQNYVLICTANSMYPTD